MPVVGPSVSRCPGSAVTAAYLLARTDGAVKGLFDGHSAGTFISSVRRRDVDRRLWIARCDKRFYAFRSDSGAGYVEWTKLEKEMAETLERLAPDYVVVDEPPLKHVLPAQVALRAVLNRRTDLIERIEEVPIRNNNFEWMAGGRLVIYRYRHRPPGPRRLNIPMLWGGRDLSIVLPERG
jgi:hypothetical protein